MIKTIEVENQTVDLIATQKALAQEGKKHLSTRLLRKYATNKIDLTEAELVFVENHLILNSCERCQSQIKIVQDILAI